MDKGKSIKVIKRNHPCGDPESEIVAAPGKSDKSSLGEVGLIVRKWISERIENSRIERVFSDNKIKSWKSSAISQDKTTS
jgi:hypothetical protein